MQDRYLESQSETISQYIRIIAGLGIKLEFGSDFEVFEKHIQTEPSRNDLNPGFNRHEVSLSPSNAIWMIGRDQNGQLACTQAMRVLPLNGLPLGDFLVANIEQFRTGGYHFDIPLTELHLTEEVSAISGTVIYHGELWLGENARGGSLATLLTRLMLVIGLLAWKTDYFIGLQSPITSCRGLGIKEGYMRTEQRSIVWQEKNKNISEDWLVWMSREEAEFNLRIPPSFFANLLKKRPRKQTAPSNRTNANGQ